MDNFYVVLYLFLASVCCVQAWHQTKVAMPRRFLPSTQRLSSTKINDIEIKEEKKIDMIFRGYDKFKRVNAMSDKFSSRKIHHVEFYTGEATASYMRFMIALGMKLRGKSDYSTGNKVHASYLLQSNDIRMVFTTPYPCALDNTSERVGDQSPCWPGFNSQFAESFIGKHGLAVRAIGLEVDDVVLAYNTIIANGGRPILPPTRVNHTMCSFADIAEISLYGDVVMRLINADNCKQNFLPGFEDEVVKSNSINANSGMFKLEKFDHIVGNVDKLQNSVPYIKEFSGFHEFAEFVAADVGTVDSGLNSVVLANNNEEILLPINEPTFGTRRKSQIQTYLEQNRGAGVQHIALYTSDIFHTMKEMKKIGENVGCGFVFMDPPNESYYARVKERLGLTKDDGFLNDDQFQLAKQYGLLLDRDDQGLLLQIFTKPVGDRPTIFFEIIQRMGCPDGNGRQKPGCGGFGKGNFRDLFKSIEDYENSLGINKVN